MHTNYIVSAKKEEVPGVTTLVLTLESGTLPQWRAGQYLTIFFPETGTPEGKAYTISSAPHEGVLAITVRDIGEFSHRLCTAPTGAVLTGSLPYGFFMPESESAPLILIASGISITPFRSILNDIYKNENERHVTLFHSISNSGDALFHHELETLTNTFPNFTHHRFITREENPCVPHTAARRIHHNDFFVNTNYYHDTEFLICGNISFTRDIWKTLVDGGIPEHYIFTEAFFG